MQNIDEQTQVNLAKLCCRSRTNSIGHFIEIYILSGFRATDKFYNSLQLPKPYYILTHRFLHQDIISICMDVLRDYHPLTKSKQILVQPTMAYQIFYT